MALIAYPNAGDRWDADSKRWIVTEESGYDPARVASWTAVGAAWIGGCCGTGPADIAALAVAVGSRAD
jgi:S-methylmethionine-dependent homocysteine/selenocysteine methylase